MFATFSICLRRYLSSAFSLLAIFFSSCLMLIVRVFFYDTLEAPRLFLYACPCFELSLRELGYEKSATFGLLRQGFCCIMLSMSSWAIEWSIFFLLFPRIGNITCLFDQLLSGALCVDWLPFILFGKFPYSIANGSTSFPFKYLSRMFDN